jgi:hypothetical protein
VDREVVDGLDEDRGVERPGHSIAAMLPMAPVAGMGCRLRTSAPPLPPDVPRAHPLRISAWSVTWEPSARAEFIRDDPERDLDRLLAGSPIEQLLLGLVMAAGGGLQT